MRRRLILTVLAVTSMVAIAFLVPLGAAVEAVAADRALAVADQEAQSLAGVLAAEPSAAELSTVIADLNGQSPRRAAAFLADGTEVGQTGPVPAAELALARTGRAFTAAGGGQHRVWVAVRLPNGRINVGLVEVPADLLTRGVERAWLLLLSVGLFVVAAAVVLADRLGRTMVRPMRDLMDVTRRLRSGDLTARVTPSGPTETAAVGGAINELAERITELLALEREAAADLSHGLRTPLAALSLEADSIRSAADRRRMARAVDDVTGAVDALIRQVRQGKPADVAAGTDLVQVVRRRLDFWALLAAEQGREWSAELPDGPVEIGLSEHQATAVVDALIGNVFAHTGPGCGFRISLPTGDGWATLGVEDDGPGLPTGLVIGRGSSGAGSTGLGLDIVARAGRSAGGDMLISAAPGGGARIEVRLPIRFSGHLAQPELEPSMMDR